MEKKNQKIPNQEKKSPPGKIKSVVTSKGSNPVMLSQVKTPPLPENIESNNHYIYLGILTLLYIAMLFIVNPIGDFPLNDDWIFAQPVYSLIKTGNYGAITWSSPLLIFQVLWGWLFCLFTGFSFTSLRFSTLVLGLAGVYILYFVLCHISKNNKLSFLIALLFLVNPLYFSLSNTFMTDVPFISMALFSIYFFLKALDSNKKKFLILAALFSVFATLIRQFGLVIPLGYAIASTVKRRQTLQQGISNFIPIILTCVVYKIALQWLKHTGSEIYKSPFPQIFTFFDNPKYWITEIFKRVGNISFYFGILFLPVLLLIRTDFKLLKSRYIMLSFLLCVTAAFILFYRDFFDENILKNGYIGPKTLSTYEFYQYYNNVDNYHEHFSNYVIFLFYIIGIAGAVMLIFHLFTFMTKVLRELKASRYISVNLTNYVFLLLCTLGYVLLVFVPYNIFDRYLVPFFPLLCLLLISESQNKRNISVPLFIFSILYASLIAIFSALGTHDYLAWNRARQQAVDFLTTNQHISMHRIDAGYETNGWLLGYGKKFDVTKLFGGIIEGSDYMLTFGDADGFLPTNKFKFTSYFPPADRYVYTMHSYYNLLNEGLNYIHKGKTDSAEIVINEFQKEVQKKPVPHLHDYLGMLYLNKNLAKDAEQEFRKEIAINGQKDDAYFQLGMMYFQRRDADNAIRCFDSTISLNHSNADAYNDLGACYMNFKGNSRKAQELFIKAIELNPNYTPTYINVLLCARNNKDEESLVKYTKILLSKGMSINDIKAKGINIPDELMKKIRI